MYKAIRIFSHNGKVLSKGEILTDATESQVKDYIRAGLIDQIEVRLQEAPENKALKPKRNTKKA